MQLPAPLLLTARCARGRRGQRRGAQVASGRAGGGRVGVGADRRARNAALCERGRLCERAGGALGAARLGGGAATVAVLAACGRAPT
jgi:hypothetical protein